MIFLEQQLRIWLTRESPNYAFHLRSKLYADDVRFIVSSSVPVKCTEHNIRHAGIDVRTDSKAV